MYKLRIVKLSAQRDMKTLVKYLLSLPGLDTGKISAGLKVPPLLVLSTDYEQEASQMLATLEKYGAVCEIENTEAVHQHHHEHEHAQVATSKKDSGGSKLFLVLIAFVLLFVSVISYFFGYNKYEINVGQIQIEAESFITDPTGWVGNTISDPAGLFNRIIVEDSVEQRNREEAMSAQLSKDLKKALVKNPYNDSVWKVLYEKLEREGDSTGAKSAKESHAKAVKAQQVLLNLARGLGDDVRVEIRDNAVYYRVNKRLTDSEFYAEAVKLKRSLNSRFPGKDLILENYASEDNVQSVTMKAE
ncbi:MAG: hypothetical protein LBC64_09705 [Fibromonadaceae bacterium]|nr:hypothetical protein [Fibromonadaceae bacterium]